MKNLLKVILNCELLLRLDKNHDSWPWPGMRIFIEMYCACRNKQGNGNEA